MGTRNLNEKSITKAVITRMKKAESARFKTVITSLVKNLHRFAREVELTEDEWNYGIDFLTRTGKLCSDKRQEFILLSDTLGLSTLVTQLNHHSHGKETEQTVFGPFHREKAPVYKMGDNISKGIAGVPCFVSGSISDAKGRPIAGAVLDVWHSDDDGAYDVQRAEWKGAMRMRGVFKPGKDGSFHLRTIRPKYYPVPTDGPTGELLKAAARHPMRPAHIHFMVNAKGYDRLVTHVFVKGDKYIDSDAVFGVRDSLISKFKMHKPGKAPDGTVMKTPFCTLHYDFVMRPAKKAVAARKH